MSWFSLILTVAGLALFEIVSSVDNAVINAEVLTAMQPKARRWFLFWGLIIAVVVIRGLLPWLIVWLSVPSLGFLGSFSASFSGDTRVAEALHQAAPVLLAGGGTFLLLLFTHWLFQENTAFAFSGEHFLRRRGGWFYSVTAAIGSAVILLALDGRASLAISIAIGAAVFFVLHGIRQRAERREKELTSNAFSDIDKLLYLEIIDSVFSVDGVLGAFAFTLSVPLILIGNGIGALVVRQLTITGAGKIGEYPYLKNGAMYSIFALSLVMLAEGFGQHIPEYISPLVTFAVIGYFFWRSVQAK